MTTLNLQVNAAVDDAYEADDNTGFDRTSTIVRIDANPTAASRFNGGMRFTSVALPKEANIDTATVQVFVLSLATDDPHLDISAEDVDSPGDFTSPADVTDRVRTTASVSWVATGVDIQWETSPEIKTVIQEIVDRGGWASGNNLVLLMDGHTTTFNFRIFSYEGGTTFAAKLDIDYIPPQALTPSGIASLEAFGSATLTITSFITASGIASVEAFGSATVSTVVFSDYGEWSRSLNPADYPSDTEFFFEAILATSSGASPAYARLFNVTTDEAVTDSEVTSTDTTGERVRSSAITLAAGDNIYKAERGGVTGATFKCFAARVVAKVA